MCDPNDPWPYGEPDVLLDLGDMIEGKNLKSGAAEALVTDRQEQASVSAEVLAMMKPKKVIACYGTPYHTGIDEVSPRETKTTKGTA